MTEEYEETKCQGYNTKKKPLFLRAPPRHAEDTWCKPCMEEKKHLK